MPKEIKQYKEEFEKKFLNVCMVIITESGHRNQDIKDKLWQFIEKALKETYTKGLEAGYKDGYNDCLKDNKGYSDYFGANTIGTNNFYQVLKNNPEEIIKWAETEIREYKKLIKLLKEQKQRK